MIIATTPMVKVLVRDNNQVRSGLRDKRAANVATVMSTSPVRGANIMYFGLRTPFLAQDKGLVLFQVF
jgi:hypothetical protein